MDQSQPPPPPYQPGYTGQYTPAPFSPANPYELARQSAAMRSYTTPAVITLVLYFVLWIPGLIANIVYLMAANDDRRTSGMEPQGRGCLVALLAVFILVPILGCVGFFGLSALMVGIGAAVSTPIP